MASVDQQRATVEDLYRVKSKAELIGGRIVHFMPTGFLPNQCASNIYVSLRQYLRTGGRDGWAINDNLGFVVPELVSGRETFSPDAAYFLGPLPANRMKFIDGPPTFAVEVRSEGDYGPAAEREQAAKRADYFEAGTLAVWDVDPEAERVHCYRADAPDAPAAFGRGEAADAEPAVPGWRVAVDDIFRV